MATRQELFKLLDQRFSGARAKELATKITRYGRSPGSSGYLAATNLAADEMRAAGFDFFETVDFPVRDAWEVTEASLDVVSPEQVRLIDLDTAGMCVCSWSDSTAPEGEVLDVVDVGTGETPAHFEGKDVKGKVVFIRGTLRRPGFWEAQKLAIQAGARGMITDYMLYQTPGVRTPELVPNAVQLLRLQVRNKPVWAFSIPHTSSLKLQELLANGPVKVKAHAACKTYAGTGRNVVATIKGTDLAHEELLFCAHTSGTKPGGNCAAGVGLVVELGRTLMSLIREGLVPRPRRSLRFLLVIEGAGTNKYLDDNRGRVKDIVATFTYCSAGNDQQKTKSALCLFRSPDSVGSYINDYLIELMQASPKDAQWVEKDGGLEMSLISFIDLFYTPWSDNTRFGAEKLPAPLFMSWPDRYFHSQLLSADVVDPNVIRRCALVGGVAALELGSAGAEGAARIASTVSARSMERIARTASDYAGAGRNGAKAASHIAYIVNRDVAAIRSVERLAQGEADLRCELETIQKGLEEVAGRAAGQEPACCCDGSECCGEYDSIIPKRAIEGRAGRWEGLSYQDLLSIGRELEAADKNSGFGALRVIADEAWNFVDGKRSVADIAQAVGFEFDLDIPAHAIYRLFEGLERSGGLKFERI